MMGEGAWGWGSTSHIYSQNSKQMQFRNSPARITTCGVGIRFAHTHLLLLYSDDWNEGDSPNEMRNNIFSKGALRAPREVTRHSIQSSTSSSFQSS